MREIQVIAEERMRMGNTFMAYFWMSRISNGGCPRSGDLL